VITDTPLASKPTRLYHCRGCEARAEAGLDNPPSLWISLRTARGGKRVLLGSFCSRQCVVEYLKDQNVLAPRPS